MKKIYVFLIGFAAGMLALFLIALLAAGVVASKGGYVDGLTLFEQPGEVMTSDSYKVLQVVDGGNALANTESGYGGYWGMVVLFLADENTHYYDDQIIDVPKGLCVRQVGTYQYPTKDGTYKTVPAVRLYKSK